MQKVIELKFEIILKEYRHPIIIVKAISKGVDSDCLLKNHLKLGYKVSINSAAYTNI